MALWLYKLSLDARRTWIPYELSLGRNHLRAVISSLVFIYTQSLIWRIIVFIRSRDLVNLQVDNFNIKPPSLLRLYRKGHRVDMHLESWMLIRWALDSLCLLRGPAVMGGCNSFLTAFVARAVSIGFSLKLSRNCCTVSLIASLSLSLVFLAHGWNQNRLRFKFKFIFSKVGGLNRYRTTSSRIFSAVTSNTVAASYTFFVVPFWFLGPIWLIKFWFKYDRLNFIVNQ